MNYIKFQLTADDELREILLAFLSTQPFESFLETENGIEGFVPEKAYDTSIDNFLTDLQSRFSFSYIRDFVAGQNWNKEWESNFHPVVVGRFCGIRAAFHQPITDVTHELIITPKMAFGTGHHETTFMMVELMKDLSFQGRAVLDYGCGTGILAILAAKLGATRIDAVDIEIESFENTRENCQTNQVSQVNVFHGMLNDVPGKSYGIVLANINRNVILDSIPALSNKMEPGAILLISGIVAKDETILLDALKMHGFQIRQTNRKNNWLAMQCVRTMIY